MKMSTFGPLKAESVELKTAMTKAANDLGSTPLLAVIYPSINTDVKKVIEILRTVYSGPIVGATTGGAGFTERGIALEGVVGGFIGGEGVSIQTAVIEDLANGLEAAVASVVGSFKAATSSGHTLFLLADAMACDGEKLATTVANAVPIHWRIFGGFAGDGWSFTGTKVIYNERVFSGGAVITYINDGSTPGVGVRHGFCPLEEAAEMKITEIDGNVLKGIDDRPALEVYREALDRRGLLQHGEDIITLLARYPIGMKTPFGEKWKIRTPMAVQDQSLVLAGSIPPGSRIRIMFGDAESLLSSARETVSVAAGGLNGQKPALQLVIDCAGRKQMLGGQYTDQVRAFRIAQDCPLLGFTSYGEFARYGGTLEGFHNTTAVTAVWSEHN